MTSFKLLFCAALLLGGSLQIPRSSIDSGAGSASSATYQLSGSIGQADAGIAGSASYQLSGGFQIAAPPADSIFRNGFD